MIDFHCHLDLYPNPREVTKRCTELGMYVLSVTTTPSAWEQSSALVVGTERIRVALGLHPELAQERKAELALFDKLLLDSQYVGEIGLDSSPNLRHTWSDQVFVFEHILSSCRSAGGRIMTIHSRRAADEVLERLEAFSGAGIPILHWYSGGRRSLVRAIDLGCWFSVGPGMIAGVKGRALVAGMPQDRVLTESDGPFATIDGRNAFPWDADLAITALAEIWNTGRAGVAEILQDNLRRLLRSPKH
jgi:TatD DNase family protein